MHLMTRNLIVFSLFIFNLAFAESCHKKGILKAPVDISFVIVDLKYNETDGVKICEVQPGSLSIFTGYDYLKGGQGLVADMFCDLLSQYQNQVWFLSESICDEKFKEKFLTKGWIKEFNFKRLIADQTFINNSSLPVNDPSKLTDYHGILYVRPNQIKSLEDFRNQYPGIIVLDAALFPHAADKSTMDKLFKSSPKLKKMRPISKLYPKQYSKALVDKILNDINSDIIVIKPKNSTKGYGVIIIAKEDLDSTLEYILMEKNYSRLKKETDLSYKYWARDRNDSFLIEQFIESDYVTVPQFDNNLYDGTMRAVVMLVYQQQQFNLHFLEGHWKLPLKSVSEPGTLNEKHKSFGNIPHFLDVDPQVLQNVQQQLREGFEELYSS